MKHQASKNGFTLIELLVVVAIIAVLLAMLMPALDKAIYQAELAVCGAQLKAVGGGALSYALENNRRYPYRAGTDAPSSGNYSPPWLNMPFGNHNKNNPAGYDDRPLLRSYMPIKAMLCPLAPGKVDFEWPAGANDSHMLTSDSLWFGWKYVVPTPSKGMHRMGGGLMYNGTTYPVLAGDHFGALAFGIFYSAHPDDKAAMTPAVLRDEPWGPTDVIGVTVSWWQAAMGPAIGRFDLNFAYEDGSVRRFSRVPWNVADPNQETRFDLVPMYHTMDVTAQSWIAIPNGS